MQNKFKKIIPFLLILIILVGIFGLTRQANASTTNPNEACIVRYFGSATPVITNAPCKDAAGVQQSATPAAAQATVEAETPKSTAGTAFQDDIDEGCDSILDSFTGCILKLVYYTYFQLPTFVLWLAALLFNELIFIGTDSAMTSSSTFLSNAWAVVRDLSNIFFILVLLYVAIKTILGMGHETKKIIAHVVIMALLINFSMFFTKVVVDSSNILALVFYNKLKINPERPNPITNLTTTNPNVQKDVSGELQHAFNVTKLVDQPFMEQLKNETGGEELPFGLTLGIIAVAGTIMLMAAYALFVSGFMFLGRLIEIWVLIIFSPFAFMSFTLPELSKQFEYVGWDEWSKRLISTSFMAPIFMFFLYLIFLILPHIFGGFIKSEGFVAVILNLLIPALIIIALLHKATKFAEKGGGQFGEMIMKGGKMVGGLAITAAAAAATGGTALAARAAIGGGGGAMIGGLAKGAEAIGRTKIGGNIGFNKVGRGLRDFQDITKKSSFDVRNTAVGKGFASATGVSMGQGLKGGWSDMKKQQVEKRQKRAQQLEERGTHHEKENVEVAQGNLKQETMKISGDLVKLEEALKKARANLSDASKGGTKKEIEEAKSAVEKAKFDKAKARGAAYKYKDPKTGKTTELIQQKGGISDLEDKVREAEGKLQEKTGKVRMGFAKELDDISTIGKVFRTAVTFGGYSAGADKDAARKIRAEVRVESSGGGKEKDKGGGHSAPSTPKPATPSSPSGGGGGGGGHGPAH